MHRIEPISKTERKSYGGKEVVNFWLKKKTEITSIETNFAREKIIELFNSSENSVICIQTEILSDKDIVTAVFNAQNRGNRTYIMTNEDNAAMKALRNSCLIRYGFKNIGSFILFNPNTNDPQAVLYTSSFSEEGLAMNENLLLSLDSEQSSILYRHFCYYFWKAPKEIIDGEAKDSGNASIDIFPPMNNFCDSEYVKKELTSILEDANIITSSITSNSYLDFAKLKKTTFVTSLSGNNNDLVKSIKKAENGIFAYKNGICVNIIDGMERGVWIIPKNIIASDDIFYALKANEEQISQIKVLFDEYKNNANYEFFDSDERKNLANKTICFFDEKDIEIKKLISKNLDDNDTGKKLIPYDEFEKAKPNEFPDSCDAVEIEYTWRNIPFSLPKNSTVHELYEQWKEKEKGILGLLDSISKNIKSTEEKEASLSSRIKSFFLGKKNTFKIRKNEIEQLRNEKFSYLEKEELKNKINKINEILREVTDSAYEIGERDRKAKLDEEIEKLQNEIKEKESEKEEKEKEILHKKEDKQSQIEKLCSTYIEQKKVEIEKNLEKLREVILEKKKCLNDKSQELVVCNEEKEGQEKLQREVSTLEEDIGKMEKELVSQEEKDRNRIKLLSNDYTADQKGLNKIKNEIDEKTGKKQREKNPEAAKKADEFLEEFNKIKSLSTSLSEIETKKRNIEGEIESKKRDIERKEKDKNNFTESQSQKESVLRRVLPHIPKDGNKPVIEQAQEFPCPNEHPLPQPGTLYQANGKDYLAINDWDEFELAVKEADRLKAILCTKREEHNG
jgi:hypothetical protein